MKVEKCDQVIMWFRRDLRVEDNAALFFALTEQKNVMPIFIFDTNILSELARDDARVTFIFDAVMRLRVQIRTNGSDLHIFFGAPEVVFADLTKKYGKITLYANEDYEPYARSRDQKVAEMIEHGGGACRWYKDHVIFAPRDILKNDGSPYTIYTPYSRKWIMLAEELMPYDAYPSQIHMKNLLHKKKKLLNEISLDDIGFSRSSVVVPHHHITVQFLEQYATTREYPALEKGTSHVGPYLRFGIVSVRAVARMAAEARDKTFLKELIWREFFHMILFYFPQTTEMSFKIKYEQIAWNNGKRDFDAWCNGQTGYPFVDAGMRELRATGHMHNRVRMVVASFLCKHLLVNWRWGERFFAQYLLDYELASNVGNWQWAAGSGCDAAPYFRVFSPTIQMKRFDPNGAYVKRWVPEYDTKQYVQPIIDHVFARDRVLMVYKNALQKTI